MRSKCNWGHNLTFQDHVTSSVFGHVTTSFPIGHFMLVVLWNQAPISNGFRDIQWRIWRNFLSCHVMPYWDHHFGEREGCRGQRLCHSKERWWVL